MLEFGNKCKVKINIRFREFYFGCTTKTAVERILLIFQDGLCSATSFKRSRRELSIDMPEYKSVWINHLLPPF